MNKGDKLYYARILPPVDVYEVEEVKVRTVENTWFTVTDERSKQAYLFSKNALGNTVFENRIDALMKVKEAEGERIYVK